MSKYPYLLLIFMILGCMDCHGMEYEHAVQGRVVDNMTGTGLDSVSVTLMKEDSTVLANTVTWPKIYGNLAGVYQFRIQKVGKYIVKVERSGYDNGYMNFELRSNRETSILVKDICMTKMSHMLPEVTVRATKVKMVMNGDTIVYNADAFNLADGSMLDALISRLPGVSLTKNGQIFVNGKYVQSLLVNGRDFFAGNPKIALENLPAYTVNKIKVYNKAGRLSTMMEKSMGDETFVMDVRLKKEYSQGYMANVDASVGTKECYMGKFFGIKYNDIGRFGVFANVNNLNDNQEAKLNGEWLQRDVPQGVLTNRNFGISYVRFLKGIDSWASSESTFSVVDVNNISRKSTQTFLTGTASSFQLSDGRQLDKNTTLNTKNQFYFQSSRNFYILNDLNFRHLHKKGRGETSTEMSDSCTLLNMLTEGNSSGSNLSNLYFEHKGGRKMVADYLRWGVSANFEYLKTERFTLYDVIYMSSRMPRDFRNNYRHDTNRQWELKGNLSYSFDWPDKSITPEYGYRFVYNKASNMLYRLDRLENMDSTRFDMLPSTREVLAHVMDDNNSYSYHEYQNHHLLQLGLGRDNVGKVLNRWKLKIPVRFVNKNLYCYRLGKHDVSRNVVFLEPNLYASGEALHFFWELKAEITSHIPSLMSMVDYRDDSDPLYVRKGNPELKNAHHYDAKLSLKRQLGKRRTMNVELNYSKRDQVVAYSLDFDSETGIFTSMPVNVNGNWNFGTKVGYVHTLDSANKWTLDNQASFNYIHNIDMVTINGMKQSQRNLANNYIIGENLKLSFRPNATFEYILRTGANYFLINRSLKDFSDINSISYHVGLNATMNVPLGFQLTTDLTMYGRRGYQMTEMNRTEWVWNAQLTHTFMKGRIIVKLQGFDILHQLSTTHYAVSEQGRTESWHNSIPRYAMLSLIWRFNKHPKK